MRMAGGKSRRMDHEQVTGWTESKASLVGCLLACLLACLLCWSISWLVGWLIGWLVCWLFDQLAVCG